MKRVTALFVATLFVGHAGIASAKLDRRVMKLMPCGGGSSDLCAVSPDTVVAPSGATQSSGGGTTTTTCETSSWGDSHEGGYQTVCSGSDGSSQWYSEEWNEDGTYTDSGSVTPAGPNKFKSSTSSSDTSGYIR